jgi:hypothetical protein
MDVTTHPAFARTYVGIEREYGHLWATRFALVAPLIIGDAQSPVYRAFVDGLTAHSLRDTEGAAFAWSHCQTLVHELAMSLVSEAEGLLTQA